MLATVSFLARAPMVRNMAMPMLCTRASSSTKVKNREASGAQPVCRQPD